MGKKVKAHLIADCSEKNSDILYLSGFRAPDPFIFYSAGREKAVIVSSLEYNRARKEVLRGIEVLNTIDFSENKNTPPKTEEILKKLSEKLNIQAWEVPGNFPLRYADFLRKNGIDTLCCDAEFCPHRSRKTKREIKLIKAALAVAEKAMMRAADIINEAKIRKDLNLEWEGEILTSEILRAEINTVILRAGAFPSDTIASCGPDSSEPHNQGQGPLKAGESIVVDIFPRMPSGYWGDITRTFVKGKAPSRVRKMFNAVKEARDYAKSCIKAGKNAASMHKAAFNVLEKRGFKTGRRAGKYYGFIHGLGHGVGLEIHEKPRLSPLNNSALEEGNVVTVEPGLYYPDTGGVRLEDMVVVTDKGCECLNRIGTELEIP